MFFSETRCIEVILSQSTINAINIEVTLVILKENLNATAYAAASFLNPFTADPVNALHSAVLV